MRAINAYEAPRWLIPALLAIAIGGAALVLFALRASEWTGDEVTYARRAAALADWATGRGSDAGVFGAVIGRGWFMPGMAALGAPLFIVFPNAPNWLAALYIGAVNAALFAGFVRTVAPVVGERWRWFLVFPLLAPLWWVGAFAFLPDLPAGLLLAIAMALAWRAAMQLLAGDTPSWRLVVALELCLIAALYLRGPMLVAALGLNAILIALALPRLRAAIRPAAGLALFIAALTPWSIVASGHFGAPVITTTNFPLVIADGFGDPARTCFGPCPPGRDIVPAWQFAQERAQATGEHPFVVQQAMMRASLEGVTVRRYLQNVRGAFGRFLGDPGGWLAKKLRLSFAVPPDWKPVVQTLALAVTWLLYAPFMLALLVTNALPVRSSDSLAVQSVLIKGMTACLFLQPFLHKSSGRYWIGFAVLGTWAALVLAAWWRERGLSLVRPDRAMPRWLDVMQVVYGTGFVTLTLAILLA